jgi:hypothetical protein
LGELITVVSAAGLAEKKMIGAIQAGMRGAFKGVFMFGIIAKIKSASIWTGMSVLNFLLLLHKALVAFWHVIKGIEAPQPQPTPSPIPTPQPEPQPTPSSDILPFPLNVVWDEVTHIVTDHIFDNLFGKSQYLKTNHFTRQDLLDFIRSDPELQKRIADVLKDKCCPCDVSVNTTV